MADPYYDGKRAALKQISESQYCYPSLKGEIETELKAVDQQEKENITIDVKEAAKMALLAQDACNLSGVVHDWSRRIMPAIWQMSLVPEGGTAMVNTHPVNVLFASKVADLTRCESEFSKAYEACKKLAE